ncbi:MAG: dihydroneopterin triphosphate diphosphatase [Burkholderiaceae bacterium]|jgi:dATP pyrophosphohydrolase|nr:dihydroneopterin triphosphate diphosphatase [Burkholderiaceae bacterium]
MIGNIPKRFKIPESVLVVIYTPALEVLLMERADKPGFWQSVTGAREEEDASLLVTAIREVAEETGIRAATDHRQSPCLVDWQITNTYEIYPEWRYKYAPGITRNTEHVFGLCVPEGTSVSLASGEHRRCFWLPCQKAAAQCFSPTNASAILLLPKRRHPAAGVPRV